MKIDPKIVKSIRENSDDIGVLFRLSKAFMLEERVVDDLDSRIINQSFFDCEKEAFKAFDDLLALLKRDYQNLLSEAKADNSLGRVCGSLLLIEPEKEPALIV